jgi:hypothetical protein
MRMWEIREKDRRSYRNMRDDDKTIEEAYECGYEDGYEDAMEHSERAYRSSSRSYRMR